MDIGKSNRWWLAVLVVVAGCAAPPTTGRLSGAAEPERAAAARSAKRIAVAIPGLPAGSSRRSHDRRPLEQPFIQADQLFASIPSLPAHVLERPYREAKETFLTHPYFTSEFIGTGPFKLKSFEPAAASGETRAGTRRSGTSGKTMGDHCAGSGATPAAGYTTASMWNWTCERP